MFYTETVVSNSIYILCSTIIVYLGLQIKAVLKLWPVRRNIEMVSFNSVCTNCQAAYVMKRKNQYLKIAHAVT